MQEVSRLTSCALTVGEVICAPELFLHAFALGDAVSWDASHTYCVRVAVKTTFGTSLTLFGGRFQEVASVAIQTLHLSRRCVQSIVWSAARTVHVQGAAGHAGSAYRRFYGESVSTTKAPLGFWVEVYAVLDLILVALAAGVVFEVSTLAVVADCRVTRTNSTAILTRDAESITWVHSEPKGTMLTDLLAERIQVTEQATSVVTLCASECRPS